MLSLARAGAIECQLRFGEGERRAYAGNSIEIETHAACLHLRVVEHGIHGVDAAGRNPSRRAIGKQFVDLPLGRFTCDNRIELFAIGQASLVGGKAFVGQQIVTTE